MTIDEYLLVGGYDIGLGIEAEQVANRAKLIEALKTVAPEHLAEGKRLLADVESRLLETRAMLKLQREQAEAVFAAAKAQGKSVPDDTVPKIFPNAPASDRGN